MTYDNMALQAFLTAALNLVLDDGSSPGGSEGMAILQLGTPLLGRINLTPPPAFISSVIRLTALQMHLLKVCPNVNLSGFSIYHEIISA